MIGYIKGTEYARTSRDSKTLSPNDCVPGGIHNKTENPEGRTRLGRKWTRSGSAELSGLAWLGSIQLTIWFHVNQT